MTLSLFVLIAWLIIIAFFLIPRSLTTEENIIMFFILVITIISINTILSLNLNLIKVSPRIEAFIASSLHRIIIIPLCYLIFMNLFFFYNEKIKKVTTSLITILVMTFIELISLSVGLKSYTGWNSFFNVSILSILMIFYCILAKLIKKIS